MFGQQKILPIFALSIADVAKLVDALDLGSSAARRVGSSPFIRTKRVLIAKKNKFFHENLFFVYTLFSIKITNYLFVNY